MLHEGDILGGTYQIVREIGKGGMGIIFLGYHLRLKKDVVIKKVKDNVAGRINVRAEADILKRLHHTYLPQVYDFLEVSGGIYTVMEYIPGENLQYYIDRRRIFPERTVHLWLRQLCEVLTYLHTRRPKILHSDIKPANIMITPEGNVCLIDFNVSLDGQVSAELQGISRTYASPEQFACAMDRLYGRPTRIVLDERMDLYSLGAVFYHLMTGLAPDAQRGIPRPIMQLNIPYSPALRSIVDRAVQTDPRRRYSSAAQMSAALENLEKLDPQYRHLQRLQVITAFCGAAAAVIGICLILAGRTIWIRDLWTDTYNEFCALAEDMADEDDASEVASAGRQILNSSLLQGYLNRNGDKKAQICYAVGDSYYFRERYGTAADWYLDALEADGTETVYLRNYLTALIRAGEDVDIEEIAGEFPEVDLSEAETVFVQAQAASESGAYEEALALCAQAAEESDDPELTAQIRALQAEIYEVTGDYAAAAEAAIEAAESDDSPDLMRKAAQAAYQAGAAAEDASERTAWYQQALSYYEELCGADSPSYTDRLNRALTLYALEEYEDSLEVLKDLKQDYDDEYEIRMWMCYCYLRIGIRDGSFSAVSSDLAFQYSVCQTLYGKSGVTDENMETLGELMDQIG